MCKINKNNTRILDYYNQANFDFKMAMWWLRTAANNNSGFHGCNFDSVSSFSTGASGVYGVSPAFRIA